MWMRVCSESIKQRLTEPIALIAIGNLLTVVDLPPSTSFFSLNTSWCGQSFAVCYQFLCFGFWAIACSRFVRFFVNFDLATISFFTSHFDSISRIKQLNTCKVTLFSIFSLFSLRICAGSFLMSVLDVCIMCRFRARQTVQAMPRTNEQKGNCDLFRAHTQHLRDNYHVAAADCSLSLHS